MNQTIKDFAIIVLLLILVLSKCGSNPSPAPSKPIVIRDTTWIKKDSVINTRPQIIQTIPYQVTSKDTLYIPDTSYAGLVKQYRELANKFLSTNISEDSIRIDTFGYVKIIDTVSSNIIQTRGIDYKLKIPRITTTIYEPYKPKNQVFVGIGVQGNLSTLLIQFNGSLLFKSKKDNILGVQAGISPTGVINYGINTYWKIKL